MAPRRTLVGLPVTACLLVAGALLLPDWSVGAVARRVNTLFQKHPWLYWQLGYGALTALVVQVLLPFLFPRLAGRPVWWTSRTVFVLLTIATVLLVRLPGLGPLELNPDESLAITNAFTLREDPRSWIAVDGGTHGPLVAFGLLPVRLFGMELEYGSARLVGLGLLLGCIFFQLGTLRTFFPEPTCRAVLMPVVICVAFLWHPEFIAYNGEHPTLLLLCGGAYGCARLAAGQLEGVPRKALATGLVLGLIPLAKLQGVPIGLTLAAAAFVILVVRFRGQGRKLRTAVLALAAGGLVPAVAVIFYLWYQGIVIHFWKSYVGWGLAYAQSSGMTVGAKFRFFLDWAPGASIVLLFHYFLCAIGAGLLFMGLAHLGSRCWRLLLVGGTVLLASVYSVITSASPFEHYLLFLLFPLGFLSAVVLATLHETQLGRMGRLALVTVCLGSAVYLVSQRAQKQGNVWIASGSDQIDGRIDPVVALIRRYASPGEPLVVWGWMDRYYVLTGMRQGTLHSSTPIEIASIRGDFLGADGPYFYQLFLRQFDQTKPPVFVDAVGVGTFYFPEREACAHENYPELRERIAADYEQVGEVYETRVYVSKARLAKLSVRPPILNRVPFPVVPFERNQLIWKERTAESAVDGSSLVFALKQPEYIQAVWLKFSYPAGEGPFQFSMYWRDPGRNEWDEERCCHLELPSGSTRSLTIPVHDTIKQFQIAPHVKPYVFQLEEIVLVVHPGDRDRLAKKYENWESEQQLHGKPPTIRVTIAGTDQDSSGSPMVLPPPDPRESGRGRGVFGVPAPGRPEERSGRTTRLPLDKGTTAG